MEQYPGSYPPENQAGKIVLAGLRWIQNNIESITAATILAITAGAFVHYHEPKAQSMEQNHSASSTVEPGIANKESLKKAPEEPIIMAAGE